MSSPLREYYSSRQRLSRCLQSLQSSSKPRIRGYANLRSRFRIEEREEAAVLLANWYLAGRWIFSQMAVPQGWQVGLVAENLSPAVLWGFISLDLEPTFEGGERFSNAGPMFTVARYPDHFLVLTASLDELVTIGKFLGRTA